MSGLSDPFIAAFVGLLFAFAVLFILNRWG
jgi:hypothetical protein